MSLSPQAARRSNPNIRPPRNNFSPTRRDLSPVRPVPNNITNDRQESSFNLRPRRQANFDTEAADTSRPLLGTETVNSVGPPLAGPEVDEMDDRETVNNPYPGVDAGFFSGNPSDAENNPDAENIPKPKEQPAARPTVHVNPDIPDMSQPDQGRYPAHQPRSNPGSNGRYPDNAAFPYAPGFGPDIYNMPDYAPTEFGTNGETIPDINVYQHKKTLAQGMMDLALFSANANQLRYVLESFDRHPYYYPSIVLISLSLIVQVAVGIGLIWNAHYNVKDKKEICIANKISNMTIIGIFVVTVVNVFVSAFGVANAPSVIIQQGTT